METSSRKTGVEGSGPFDADTIERVMRERVRAMIELIVEQELERALRAPVSARVGAQRSGYRHGHRERTLTTSLGPTTIAMPRARVAQRGGGKTEWHSETVRRYERRTQRVDEAILGCYLSGANTRRIKGALAPLLRGGPLSKDAVSRLTGRLKEEFEGWRTRDLGTEHVRYLTLDGWYPRVRVGRHRVRVPVLVTMGVCADGRRIVLDLRLAGEETAAGWREVVESLVKRHIGRPALALVDGNPGLADALREQWPKMPIQRCTAHKLRNLLAKVPAALREELTEDYHRMVYADTATGVEHERKRFRAKWQKCSAAVVASLDEAGDDLFTFLKFPKSQWKALRTTNALERINGEFRRRTKTQASLPNEDAVLLLLFGLLRAGQVKLRKIDGYEDMPSVPTAEERQAA
jgi:transposase-like protein